MEAALCIRDGHRRRGFIGTVLRQSSQTVTRRAKAQELSYGDANFHKELAWQQLDQG